MPIFHPAKTFADLVAFATNPMYFRPPYKDREEIGKVLREVGFVKFESTLWYAYSAALMTTHSAKYGAPKIKARDPNDPLDNPVCPVCGGPRRILTPDERKEWSLRSAFGQPYPWACDAGPYPMAHYIRWGFYLLLKKRLPLLTIQDLSSHNVVLYDDMPVGLPVTLMEAWDDPSVTVATSRKVNEATTPHQETE